MVVLEHAHKLARLAQPRVGSSRLAAILFLCSTAVVQLAWLALLLLVIVRLARA